MLFDDEEQLEVRHVISLAHHDISIYSGGDVTPEGELFIKRNALCLSRRLGVPDKQTPDSQLSKPFYLFSENCSAKEDFYFALLKNQEQTFGFDSDPPIPKGFEVKNIISLVQRLHSSEDHVHSRWFNALLGRVFLAVYRTSDLENFIREKITKKISRVNRPSFLENITIQKIETGEAAPFFTNLKLKDLTVEGECVVEADVRYTGNFRIEVGATVKIDLGTRFKAREVNIVLSVLLKRVEGHVMFKVKAPPSNRLWMSFQTMPKMEMAIEPIVSSRQITYTIILRQIENRIKEVFAETLVQPFWDDVPFFKTEHKKWRGGIFQADDAVESSEASQPLPDGVPELETLDRMEDEDLLKQTLPMEKSLSVPQMEPQAVPAGLFGRKAAKNPNGSATSVLSSGIDAKGATTNGSGNNTPKSLNILKNSTDPVVGTETAHADIFKPSSSPPDQATNFMASLASRSQEASPLATPFGSPAKASSLPKASSLSSASSKEADDNDKGGNQDEENREEVDGDLEATPVPTGRRDTTSSAGSMTRSDDSVSSSPVTSATGSFKSQAGSIGRNFFMRRENTSNTTASSDTTGSSDLKKNTLAAVTNAAVQARQWGWNAYQRQKEARRNGDKAHQVDLSQPMGRGQPLPPPGMPLPGPNGSSKIGATTAPKRKPVPPPTSIPEGSAPTESSDADKEHRPQQPPPLPNRRRRGTSQQLQEEELPQNMLVVAAPDDSQPGTPAEEKASYIEPWIDSSIGEAEPSAEALVRKPDNRSNVNDSSVMENRTPPELPERPSSNAKSEAPRSNIKAGDDKPRVVTVEAVGAVGVDDDDDFSGWLEDDDLPEDQAAEIVPSAIVGEVK